MNSYCYSEIFVGQTASFQAEITSENMERFLAITGDENPLHNDREYAISAGQPDRVVYGMLTASFLSTLAGVYLPGKFSLIHTVETQFLKPVFIGDQLTIEGEVTEKNDSFQVIWLKVRIRNQTGKTVCKAKMRVGVTQ